MGDLLTTKVKLQSRLTGWKTAFCFTACCVLFTGCSADLLSSDSKTSFWEQQWLDGSDALSEGRLVDARNLLEAAVTTARGTKGSDMRVGVTLDRLGDAYAQSNMGDQAEKAYQAAIDAFDKSLSNDKSESNQNIVLKEQIGTFSSLASIWLAQNKYKKSEKFLDRAVANAKAIGITDTKNIQDKLVMSEYGACLQQLGIVYENTGRKEKAAKTYLRASKFMPDLVIKDDSSSLFRSVVGDTKQDSGLSSNDTARLNDMIRKWQPIYQAGMQAHEEGDTAGAQASLKKAYQLARAFSPSAEPTIDSLTELIRTTNKLHRYPESERLFNENRAVLMTGEPTKAIDNVLGEANKTYIRQRKWSEAERVLIRRIKVRETLRGPTNIHVAETLNELGTLYIEMKQPKQAELVLQKALKIADNSDHQDSDLAAKITLRLSTLKEAEK